MTIYELNKQFEAAEAAEQQAAQVKAGHNARKIALEKQIEEIGAADDVQTIMQLNAEMQAVTLLLKAADKALAIANESKREIHSHLMYEKNQARGLRDAITEANRQAENLRGNLTRAEHTVVMIRETLTAEELNIEALKRDLTAKLGEPEQKATKGANANGIFAKIGAAK